MANFKYQEVITTSEQILDAIKASVVGATYPFSVPDGETEVLNTWVFEAETEDATSGFLSNLTLKCVSKIGAVTKTFYVKFVNLGFTTPALHSSMSVQLCMNNTIPYDDGHTVIVEWAKQNFLPATDRTHGKPVYLFMNLTNNHLAMGIVGDPAVNFNDYRKSFFYVGAITPFSYNMDDVDGNILLTGGSVTAEVAVPSGDSFYQGVNTSVGNNTFQMYKTKSGIKFQQHFPAFITQVPTTGKAYVDGVLSDTGLLLEPQGFNASKWTSKYHLSPIYVVHPYDGYRGSLDYTIAVSKNNILHLDELIVDIPVGTPGKTWAQEVYKFFDHNTEQNFMNRSANVKMGVAILKEVRY